LPLPFFFTWPLAISSGLLGFGLAFVPVEERPMDIWTLLFFKNVYSPTQWVWQKEKRVVVPHPKPGVASSKTSPPPTPHTPPKAQPTLPHAPPVPPVSGAILSIHHATNPLDWLRSIFTTKSKSAAPSLSPGFSFADALAARPAPSLVGQHVEPPKQSQWPTPPQVVGPQASIQVAPGATLPSVHPATHERVVELQGQLSEALAQRERLEKELITMRQRMDNQTKGASQAPMRQASVVHPSPAAPATSVRVIAPDAAAKAGLPRLTTFPNVVTGIVKDHYGNLLSGMLITVRDKDDIPLRALKTNKLGQFAASTPLPNNTYIVEIGGTTHRGHGQKPTGGRAG
ncbi:hypothetical protein HY087_01225, partial [Candidatus Gottesmanbacteria bacterium]|nr:hypothetical protein [Candidatus Gottesmanbacteria bacterium]